MAAGAPEVSVVMPCFNGARWIAAAIESVLAQTFQNFELVLVDDGSTDATVSIIRRYGELDRRVVVVEKPHTDVSDSLNVGLARARGAWVARLDQDDLCAPTRLSEQMAFVEQHPGVVFVGSAFVRLDENDRVVNTHWFPSTHDKLMINLERMKGFCPHSTALFQRDLAMQVGGYRFCVNNANDHDLWLRLSAHGRLACLPVPLVQCRGHSGQMSHDGGGDPQLIEGVAGGTAHFVRKLGCPDPLIDGPDSRVAEFLDFVRDGVRQSRLIEGRAAWGRARAEFLKRRNRLIGAAVFLGMLVRSGWATRLLWEKFYGFSLPRRLARTWTRKTQSCAASSE